MIKIRLVELLKKRGMSQTELSARLGVDKNTISRFVVRGVIRLDVEMLNTMCELLQCTPNDIFEYTKDEKIDPEVGISPVQE